MNRIFRYYNVLLFISICLAVNGQWSDSTYSEKKVSFLIDTNNNINNSDVEYNFFNGEERSDNFYDSLALKAGKKNWSRELHRLIVRNTEATENQNINEHDRISYFLRYEGKAIRNIQIRQLDVFGPTITDTSRNAEQWVEKMGNSMHVSTNKRFIENNLFIDEGEHVDPYILMDNERILRSISSLQDVRIYVIPIQNSPDSIDIQILTKDVMAFGLNWEIYDVAYGEASIWNSNILGLGHQLNYTAYYNLNDEPKYGYGINYKIANISNSFTSLELLHTNRKDLLVSAAQATKRFITPATRFGGGIGYTKTKRKYNLETIDSIIPDIISNYEYYDFWGGYSIPIKEVRMLKVRKNYFFTGRVQLYNFFDRPGVSENNFYDFYSRNIYLGSVGLTWQGYHTTRLVYGFGDTEDLPFGAMIKLTGGFEQNEFNRRQYYGAVLTHSICTQKAGYFSNTFELGGFYRNKIEQGAIKYNLLHISPLLGNKRHNFRNFISLDYTQGVNRFDDEFTLIENKDGIRGYSNSMLKGNKRLYVNNEFVYYSPHYIYGFRFVYFAFADAGIINYSNNYLIENPVYMSAGIGVRVRNERLIFNTIQLQFNFFPISPETPGANKQNIDFISYPQYRMPEFAKRKPEIIEY